MAWQFQLSPKASKELTKLDPATRQAIIDYLVKQVVWRDDPYEVGKALRHDKRGLWRYRVGKYRIICEIQDAVLVILVVTVGKRDSVYD